MKSSWVGVVAITALQFACSETDAEVVSPPSNTALESSSIVLAPLIGPHYRPAVGQSDVGFYGTDMGFTYRHRGQLRILFGDTWAATDGTMIGAGGDDAHGVICLSPVDCPGGRDSQGFPDGDSVEAYVKAHPPRPGEFSWQYGAPPVFLRLNATGHAAPIAVYRGGAAGTLLPMGPSRTPAAAFSNAKTGDDAAAFAIFNRLVSVPCSGGASPTCEGDLVCDTGLGSYFGASGDDAIPCLHGSPLCAPNAGGGFCIDDTNSFYQPADDGLARLNSVASRLEVGAEDPANQDSYYARGWQTRRFFNLTVRAVNDFLPTRESGAGNDYNLPDASTTGRERLFLWGRPGFVGTKAAGRSAKLYFAYVDMPDYAADGRVEWAPQYYVGTSNGVPQFSPNQRMAKALDLTGAPTADTEAWDVVNHMSIAFVKSVNKWVMFYGGDLNDGLIEVFSGGQGQLVERDPEGAIHVRWTVADDPWGPWTAPEQLFKAGDFATTPPVADSSFAPGGILHHPDCNAADCAPFEALWGDQTYGVLYGPNIIPEWTEERGAYVDLYWNVSTWNPYQVVLLKSRFKK